MPCSVDEYWTLPFNPRRLKNHSNDREARRKVSKSRLRSKIAKKSRRRNR